MTREELAYEAFLAGHARPVENDVVVETFGRWWNDRPHDAEHDADLTGEVARLRAQVLDLKDDITQHNSQHVIESDTRDALVAENEQLKRDRQYFKEASFFARGAQPTGPKDDRVKLAESIRDAARAESQKHLDENRTLRAEVDRLQAKDTAGFWGHAAARLQIRLNEMTAARDRLGAIARGYATGNAWGLNSKLVDTIDALTKVGAVAETEK